MYTKQNFQIAKIADKVPSRFTLQAIHVTPSETVCTDGHRLVRVKTTGETGEFTPFNMAAKQALDAAKHAKDGAAFTPDTHVNGHVTVQAGSVTLTADKPEGLFPDYRRVIPAADSTWHRVAFSAKYMKELMELHAASGDHVVLYLKTGNDPIVMETTGGDGPHVQSVLMPCRLDNVSVERY